ncbi:DoxX family protein [Modestobacter sp. VKM Ac-2979]|uniref:DoxX family protein n=1 Tax=unclassified Modestobacter TaxID=2643866 RepID=UPI0022ABC4D9|nr:MULTISPECIES: DoxX family protein [unclassified Modestobacter]MCZ2811969.1 DoxX family protein [Modestobacter sp. VKM Ac-2979]MCZ2843693.1 DoxX family protein [Modestobacter sp. VKM Ac-2980]
MRNRHGFPAPARDIAVLLVRLALRAVFSAHGWQRQYLNAIDGTAAYLDRAGVPATSAAAWFAAIVELVGGVALSRGLGVPIDPSGSSSIC